MQTLAVWRGIYHLRLIEYLNLTCCNPQEVECVRQIFTAMHQIVFWHSDRKHKCQLEGADGGKFRENSQNHRDLSSGSSSECAKFCDGINHRISETITCSWQKKKKDEGSVKLATFIMRTPINLVEAEIEFVRLWQTNTKTSASKLQKLIPLQKLSGHVAN